MDWKYHKVVCKNARVTVSVETSSAQPIQPLTSTESEISRKSEPDTVETSSVQAKSVQHTHAENATSGKSEPDDKVQKYCRCMFCGEQLLLSSEDEAIEHMEVCSSLQEQLASKDQFTVPSVIKDKVLKQHQNS